MNQKATLDGKIYLELEERLTKGKDVSTPGPHSEMDFKSKIAKQVKFAVQWGITQLYDLIYFLRLGINQLYNGYLWEIQLVFYIFFNYALCSCAQGKYN